jgi:hypothetical protein
LGIHENGSRPGIFLFLFSPSGLTGFPFGADPASNDPVFLPVFLPVHFFVGDKNLTFIYYIIYPRLWKWDCLEYRCPALPFAAHTTAAWSSTICRK